MLILFGFSLFLGAGLIFLIQPMVAKMILPYYGGSPAVWNTCMVFFQAGLLGGYAYAHVGPTYLGLRRHAVVHLLLMLLPFLLLPIYVTSAWAPPPGFPPVLYLLAMLVLGVGLPFFLVSATAPLLQRWFAATGHASAKDPYFLYVASNLGSLLALLSYPALMEPVLTRYEQSWFWVYGYVGLVVLLAGCVVALLRFHAAPAPAVPLKPELVAKGKRAISKAINWKTRVRWVVLAFIPSSLMLSVTTYLTTDIAAIPLLWVIPLAVYLLTFILTFSQKPVIPHAVFQRIMPLTVLLLTIILLSEGTEIRSMQGMGIIFLMGMHLLGLFIIGMVCHGELARSRPDPQHLTEFYLWLATGGVLGGLFNALLAPVLFMKTGITEYPLVLVLACLFRQPRWFEKKEAATFRTALKRDILPSAGLLVLTLALVLLTRPFSIVEGPLRVGIIFGVPAVICYTLLDRPLRYGLGIGALFVAGIFNVGEYGRLETLTRSFFGIHRITIQRITKEHKGNFRELIHGNTVHGAQSLWPWEQNEPLTYYHRSSPIGAVFATWQKEQLQPETPAALVGLGAAPTGVAAVVAILQETKNALPPLKDVAVVGLGTGSLAAYAQPGQNWTFYEIDPTVPELARRYFTYLHDAEQRLAENGKLQIVLGDARLKLAEKKEPKYDLLIVDAFNSDAVPVHLLTKEAMQVYRNRLKKHGVLAFHISNRHLNLEPVLAELAANAKFVCYSWRDQRDFDFPKTGKSASHWVIMGTDESPVEMLARRRLWRPLEGGNPRFLWSDDFSNIFSIFRWSRE